MDEILIKTKTGFKTVATGVPTTKQAPINSDMARAEISNLPPELEKFVSAKMGGSNVLRSAEVEISKPLELVKEEKIEKKGQPSVVIKKATTPAFYFDVKDEEEADRFKDSKLDQERKEKESFINLAATKIARQIKTENGLEIVSVEQMMKLEKIIASRLREARSLITTKEALIRRSDAGGFNWNEAAAERAIRIIEREKKKWEINPKDFIKEDEKKDIWGEKKNNSITPEPLPAKNNLDDNFNPELQKIATALRAQKQKNTADIVAPAVPAPRQSNSFLNRDKYDEELFSRGERRVMGPIEELLNLDLAEFRSLGRSPKEAVNKVYEKVNILGRNSLEDRSKGIEAWKKSPLYLLYIAIGEESLNKFVSVEAVLKEKKNLTWDEFQAIGDLNEQLNY